MRSSYEGWTVREAYDELGTDVLDLLYDSGADDFPETSDGELASLIDNEGIDVEYDEMWGKQIYTQGEPAESAVEKFSGLLGKIDPFKRLGEARTEAEGTDSELVNSYENRLKPSHAALGGTAGASLMAGPQKGDVLYELFNDGLPEDILFGIGAVAGTGIVAGQRYDSGKAEVLDTEIKERRAEELVERFGDYKIKERN